MRNVNTIKSYRQQVNAPIVLVTRYQLVDNAINRLAAQITELELMESATNVCWVKRLVQMDNNVFLVGAKVHKLFQRMGALIVRHITMLIH